MYANRTREGEQTCKRAFWCWMACICSSCEVKPSIACSISLNLCFLLSRYLNKKMHSKQCLKLAASVDSRQSLFCFTRPELSPVQCLLAQASSRPPIGNLDSWGKPKLIPIIESQVQAGHLCWACLFCACCLGFLFVFPAPRPFACFCSPSSDSSINPGESTKYSDSFCFRDLAFLSCLSAQSPLPACCASKIKNMNLALYPWQF